MESQNLTPQTDDPSINEIDRRFIQRTYQIARNAIAKGNHPFGALIERNGEVILEIENAVVTTRDVTKHAETLLIGEATQKFDAKTLADCTLYTSTEPCIMCCGAIYWAGVKKIVFGASADKMMRIYSPEECPGYTCHEIFSRMAPKVDVAGPVDEETGLKIHADFWPKFLEREKSKSRD